MAQVAMQAATPQLTKRRQASMQTKDPIVRLQKVRVWHKLFVSMPGCSVDVRGLLGRQTLDCASSATSLRSFGCDAPPSCLNAGSHDRAPPAPAEPSPGLASTAADAKAEQHSAAAVNAKLVCPSLSPLTEPNTPAAGADDSKIACGQTAPSAAISAGSDAIAAQAVQAKQQQRRQAVARFKVRLLERAPSPAVLAPVSRPPAQPTAACTAEAIPVQPDASAARMTIVPSAVPTAVPQGSVLGQQQTEGLVPGSLLGQGVTQTAAAAQAPTANGTHDPQVAASPAVLLPAPDAPLSAVLPRPCVLPTLRGPVALLSNPTTPSKAMQGSPLVPQVTLHSRLNDGNL